MKELIDDILNIRFVKIQFTLVMPEECVWPKKKSSALRGGMGEMLLRANCIRDRKCEACDFESECIVQRTMYSKFENIPQFMNAGNSVGYVINCENYKEKFSAGDKLQFSLTLFGKTLVYFNQFLNAFFALGQNGVGKHKAKFLISSIENSYGEEILHENNIFMEYYKIQKISDYVKYRLEKIKKEGLESIIVFKTPLTQKYKGEFLKQFDMDAIVRSVKRRIFILSSFEGNDVEEWYMKNEEVPIVVSQTIENAQYKRYSNRKKESMELKGIEGTIVLDCITEDLLWILLAGEVMHIGKNTSFGFGKYIVK